jgi:hypothetical protein
MANVLQGIIGKYAQNYLDEILIYSDTETEHLKHVEIILGRLGDAELKVSIKKCVWATDEVDFLGHSVGRNGLRPKASNI